MKLKQGINKVVYDIMLTNPKKLTLQNKSLEDFLRLVVPVINGEKIYVSNQIFKQQWLRCDKHNGAVKIGKTTGKILYSFQFYENNQNKVCAMFCVDPLCRQNEKKIQLVFYSSKNIKFQFQKSAFNRKFYIDNQAKNIIQEK